MSLNRKPLRAIRLPQVVEKTSVSRAQIYKLAKVGKFPKPHSLTDSGCISAWDEAEVDQWLADKFSRAE